MTEPMTTPEILDVLGRRYPQDKAQWANLVEFERVDFLAVATWGSLKWAVHGHEVKASRADWRAELRAGPAKAGPGRLMCDYWWLAAGPGVIKDPNEVPPSWGILSVTPDGVRRVRPAVRLRPEPSRQWDLLEAEGGVLDGGMDWETRRLFSMMARRAAYAQADAAALADLLGHEVGPPAISRALDVAAVHTGRITGAVRARQGTEAKVSRAAVKRQKSQQEALADIVARQEAGNLSESAAEREIAALWGTR